MKKILLLLLLSMSCLTVCIYAGQNFTNNLSSGWLSPLVKYRIDIAQRQSGTEEMTNFLVKQTGQVTRRPGTEYISGITDVNVSLVNFGDTTLPTGGVFKSFSDTAYFAQTFLCPYNVTVSDLYLFLTKSGTPGVTNIQIWGTLTDNELTGKPVSTSVLATATVDLSLVNVKNSTPPSYNGSWVKITFSTPATLIANKLYAVVGFATGSSLNNAVNWQRISDSTSTYYGRTWNANSPGTTWTIYNTPDYPLKFVNQTVTSVSLSGDTSTGELARLIPFVYSTSDAYILSFGQESITFYRTEP